MSRTVTALLASGLVAAGLFAFAGAASAAPIANAPAFQNAVQDSAMLPNVETVRWRGRGGWGGRGWGYGGFAGGAIIGGALLARPYYGPSPYYGYGYAPYYAPPPPPAYYGTEDDGPDDGYCARRFKSYDPRSGTYLGYDGIRHPCP